MSSGLMLYDIILNILSNNKLEFHNKEDDLFLKDLEQQNLYVKGVTSILLLGKRHIQVSRCSMCTFSYWKKPYETLFEKHIKSDTPSRDMNEG